MNNTCHVLLANGSAGRRSALRGVLEASGYGEITEVSDGAAALRALNSGTIDALVTDIPLANVDGWRLARLARSGVLRCRRDLPIIVVSSSYSERIAEVTAKEYEINGFITFEQRLQLPQLLASPNEPWRPTLLVVEDDPDIQQIVCRVLDRRFRIEQATDGQAALDAWRRGRHNLVLLDVMLPRLSGAEVLAAILEERPAQSVVIMTADGTPQRAIDLMLAGAADFITKPFRAEQLRQVCEIAARREDYMLSNEQFARQLAALDAERERALVTLESIGEGVIATDRDGMVEYLNPVAERLTGLSIDAARGRPLRSIFHVVNHYSGQPLPDLVERSLSEGNVSSHGLLRRGDGGEVAIESSASPLRDREDEIVGVVLVCRDVTEARELHQQISYQSTHDSLTGLFNRTEFETRLSRLLKESLDNGSEHVLCYLDLDQFKVVNDTCGHLAGDQLLQQMAVILNRYIRQSDTLARLGGDEFGILLAYCSVESACKVVEELRQAVQDFRFKWQDNLFALAVSIGLVPLNKTSGSPEEALSAADTACYIAKEMGRNRVHLYGSDDGELVQRHGEMQWVSKVNRAFAEERFRLYFQRIVPIGRAPEGEHFELLIRMVDEDGKVVAPGLFLPAVERYGLAVHLDSWVLSRALAWLGADAARMERIHLCAINLSGKSLGDEHFHQFVEEQLGSSKVPPSLICFEITETAAITNLRKAADFIQRFKSRGCRFSLDDFGSGMSSFAYLKSLPVDYLKIDGVFVKDIVDDKVDRAMVRSINEVAQVIGLKTVAEFVENEEILSSLHAIGVDYAQGYHVAKPRPIEELDGMLS